VVSIVEEENSDTPAQFFRFEAVIDQNSVRLPLQNNQPLRIESVLEQLIFLPGKTSYALPSVGSSDRRRRSRSCLCMSPDDDMAGQLAL
jgi:hypothetical protein